MRNTSAQGLGRALHGRTFTKLERRGKWLLAGTEDGAVLVVHFGMTGGLRWSADARARHPHDRVVLVFGDGELRYRNMRKLGGVWLARSERDVAQITGPLGPDALAVGREDLETLVARARGALKPLLMNQRRIAGIGNELSDEILWRAKLHPCRAASSLARRERGYLYRAMSKVLTESARLGRIPRRPSWLTSQRGRADARCPRCHAGLERSRVGGRTAYWCPRCQARKDQAPGGR